MTAVQAFLSRCQGFVLIVELWIPVVVTTRLLMLSNNSCFIWILHCCFCRSSSFFIFYVFQSLHCVLIYVSFMCLYFFCVYLSLTSCSVLAYISVSFLLVISCFNLKAAVLCYLILVLLLSFCWLSASCFHLRCFRPLFCPRHCSVLQLAFCVHTARSLPLSDLFIISLNFCLFVCVPSRHKPTLPPSVQVLFLYFY